MSSLVTKRLAFRQSRRICVLGTMSCYLLFKKKKKKPKRVFACINCIPKTMGQFCYFRLSWGIETVSCPLLPRMGRMNMDSSLKNFDQLFRVLMQKSRKRYYGLYSLMKFNNNNSFIWTRDDREKIQQVTRAGLEPGTAGLQVRPSDHSATLSPCVSLSAL